MRNNLAANHQASLASVSVGARSLYVKAMPIRDAVRALYLSLFCRLASAYLRNKPRNKLNLQVPPSVKIIARYSRPGGITNGAIHNALALQSLGYNVERVDVSPAIRNPLHRITCTDGGPFIFHCDAAQFLLFAWSLRRNFKNGRMIGYFAWELAAPPTAWPKYDDFWDEIWTPSTFSAQSLAKHYDCPIRVVPHVVMNEGTPRLWRKGQEPLTFLTMADARSSFVRKNPRAVIAAFRQAFPKETDVALVVKLQTSRSSSELENIFTEIGGDQRIRVIQETLERSDINRLFTSCHVYVSLHRAEGFGLPILEARTFGLATIATAYSGNLDFMTPRDSILIPYKPITMWDEGGVYGQVTWADPDVSAAADAMRSLYELPALLAEIATFGWQASRPEEQLAAFAKSLETAGLVARQGHHP